MYDQAKKNYSKGKIVEITEAPDCARPNGLFKDGVRVADDPLFLHRADTGKIAVLIEQKTDEEPPVWFLPHTAV